MSTVWAFDPGTTTGVAFYDLEAGVFSATQLQREELYKMVDQACESIGHARIEAFSITTATAKKSPVPDPLYIIGYLQYAAWRCDFPISYTKPADVMATFTDAALRRAGFYRSGIPHGMDATRHLAHFLTRNKHIDARMFLP